MKKTYFLLICLMILGIVSLLLHFGVEKKTVKKIILMIDASDTEKKALKRSSIQKLYSFLYYNINSNEKDLVETLQKIKQHYKKGDFDGVLSTQDYLGNICASLVAEAFKLPGPALEALLTCHHKYYSRRAQKRFVPKATPRFGLIDPNDFEKSIADLPLTFPFFVKPIKSYFSFGAMKIYTKEELQKKILHLLPSKAFLKPLENVLKQYTNYKLTANYLLAENILEGKHVTVEGFVKNGKVHIVGIVDSIMYSGTISFEHFEYPSSLPIHAQKHMIKIAKKFIKGIKFDNSFFNIEMMYNDKINKIHIIEVNPRSVAQFSDLYEKVDGANSYDMMLALATGSSLPTLKKRKGKYGIAASFALRVFENGFVKKSPSNQELAKTYQAFPDSHIQIHVQKGQKLSSKLQDGKSYVYAIINLGGKNKQDLLQRFEQCKNMLTFEIVPISTSWEAQKKLL